MGMENFSLLEAVEVALLMEEEGIRFYGLAEERTGDPELKRLFATLKDREFQHLDTFRRLYSGISEREGSPDAELWLLDEEVSSYFRAYVDSAVFPGRGAAERAIAELHGAADILRFALRIEKESILYYQELLSHGPWPQARELVEKVIAEERRHFRLIHEKLASLGG